MTETITTGLLSVAVVIVIGYLVRLDMADMTGFARKAAKDGMGALASELNYERVQPRTQQKQGGLEKRLKGFNIEVDTDRSRIQLKFSRNTRLRLSSLDKNDFDEGGMATLTFSDKRLNQFFPLRAGAPEWASEIGDLETLLLPLAEQFDVRAVKYLYVKDEYLRVGFYHRNYLPVSVIHGALPVLETFGEKFVQLQKQGK